MQKLIDVYGNPSAFDSKQNYFGDTPNDQLLVVMVRNRDSDILSESNWDCALELLKGESNTVEIVRFGHWACGWIEYMCVIEGSESQKIGQDIVNQLESYPILNEDHFSESEQETADQIWRDCYTPKERIEYIRKNREQFDFYDFSDLMSCVKGKYFSGYASELIY